MSIKNIWILPSEHYFLYIKVPSVVKGKNLKKLLQTQINLYIKKNGIACNNPVYCWHPISGGIEIYFFPNVSEAESADFAAPLYSILISKWNHTTQEEKDVAILYVMDVPAKALGYTPKGRNIPPNFDMIRIFHAITPSGKTVYYEFFYEEFPVDKIVSLVEREAQSHIRVESVDFNTAALDFIKRGKASLYIRKKKYTLRAVIILVTAFILLGIAITNGVYAKWNYESKNRLRVLNSDKSSLQLNVGELKDELKFWESLPIELMNVPKWNASETLQWLGKKFYVPEKTWVDEYIICRNCGKQQKNSLKMVKIGAVGSPQELKKITDDMSAILPPNSYTMDYMLDEQSFYTPALFITFQEKQQQQQQQQKDKKEDTKGGERKNQGNPGGNGKKNVSLYAPSQPDNNPVFSRSILPTHYAYQDKTGNKECGTTNSQLKEREDRTGRKDWKMDIIHFIRHTFSGSIAYAATVNMPELQQQSNTGGSVPAPSQVQGQSGSLRSNPQSGGNPSTAVGSSNETTELLQYLRSQREQRERTHDQTDGNQQEKIVIKNKSDEEKYLGLDQFWDTSCPNFTQMPTVLTQKPVQEETPQQVLQTIEKLSQKVEEKPKAPPFPKISLVMITDNMAIIKQNGKLRKMLLYQKNLDGLELTKLSPSTGEAEFSYFGQKQKISMGSVKLKEWTPNRKIVVSK